MTITRIQQFRGRRLPLGARSVARPSRWGSPYRLIEHGGEYPREQAIALYRQRLLAMQPAELAEFLAPLRTAKALACYCSLDKACHVDVLIEMLKAEPCAGQKVSGNEHHG
jgi:hypothetical protein